MDKAKADRKKCNDNTKCYFDGLIKKLENAEANAKAECSALPPALQYLCEEAVSDSFGILEKATRYAGAAAGARCEAKFAIDAIGCGIEFLPSPLK